MDVSGAESESDVTGIPGAAPIINYETVALLPGQLGGILVDSSGAVIANAEVAVNQAEHGIVRKAITDSAGRWIVSNLSSGPVRITASAPGYKQLVGQISYDGGRPAPLNYALSVGAVAESVAVMSDTNIRDLPMFQREVRKSAATPQNAASPNVANLQQRISGVLPVRIDVPRAGNSYHFFRPLVLDEETKVSFAYKTK